jgi:[acyl-carrier-protein] S-malonyltransferase
MFVLLAPGQGAQKPGFLTAWLELPSVANRLRWWSAVTELDLVALGTTADAETIRDTAVAQPLLVAASLAVAAELLDGPVRGAVTAGHSVGEFAAAAIAGSLSPEAALVLVRERGRAMAAASALTPTGMSAVLGGEPVEVSAALDALGLTAANQNGSGQVVAAGPLEALARLAADPPARARVRALSVAGAFHTAYMVSARDTLADLGPGIAARDPRMTMVSNADGSVVSSGPELLARLVAQVAAPVRWDLCMQTLGDLGVTAVIELPPAGTLTGLVRRALPGVEALALNTPADLPAARSLMATHPAPSVTEHAPAWRLVVAPLGGTFHREPVAAGDVLDQGASLGVIGNNRAEQRVAATHGGTLVEWLAEDGDPITAGQPLARLHPVAAHQ